MLRTIGRGGTGITYLATADGTHVVVKVFENGTPAERITNEVTALAAIDSPHVVGVVDVSAEPEGPLSLVHERLSIQTLADWLRKRGIHDTGEVITAAVSTGSGDVVIDHSTSSVVVKTGSGNLEIGDAEGDVAMKTGSGDTVIRAARRGRITSKGASGNVQIGIPAGTPVWTDVTTVTGRLHSSIEGVGQPEPGADHVELRASTVSGDVVLAAV